MNRVMCVAIIAGSLLCLAPWAWADEAAIPAYFSVLSEHDQRDAQPAPAATPSVILQVAAQTDIPQPKIFSVSTTNLDADNGQANSSYSSGGSNGNSSCDQCGSQCGSSSCCGQSGNNCNCNGCSNACGHGCCNDCCCDCFRPTWTFKAGAVVLDRVSPRSTAMVVETGTGRSLMNASGFSFNWDGGLDASLIRRMGDDNNLEARYFGVNNFTARQAFLTTTPANIPTTPPENIPPSAPSTPTNPLAPNVNSRFDSSLYSAEINWHHESTETIGWLAGFRWLQTNDALGITFPDPVVNRTFRSVTDNQLCGGQIGADLKVWEEGGPLRIDTVLKAGLYNNNASNVQDSHSQLAFVGEIGVNIIYQCCDHVALSAGYELLWLDGVAVATEQIPVINRITNSGIDSGGDAFYHGAMFSVNCAW